MENTFLKRSKETNLKKSRKKSVRTFIRQTSQFINK